ncbi:putative dehydrogenase [Natronobacillus azotifigens]|uniref:Gfo/Idh/MocA family oxidoreductase n=1 Tax=Natronobacillus azotifigens TaxID=472978 RepID=A0A9J6RES5_9BACI|nr:Gfo/Idh/MocA family oxidoreductase [Natronobacillus azotifigens]MCZ0703868.1 Gfo/Idh/MocA family oxidoreductase [Natronobacillus azotifigens]
MKIATIGTGFIVDTFLAAVQEREGVTCEAVYSRRKETAQPLADKYQVGKIYTDVADVYEDEAIDVIYVASPNSLHYQYMLDAIKHGKHVICEKPFTSNEKEAAQIIELAKENQVMLFEAITTIHLPNYQWMKNNLEQLGQIKFVQCNYSQFSSRYNKLLSGETPNVFNLKFSGGALADINIYNLHFVLNMFGKPDSVNYTANKHENGIDTSGVVVMKYPEFIAECVGSKDADGLNFVVIQGEKGYLHVVGGANGCREVVLHINGQEKSVNMQLNDNLLYYELGEFQAIYESKDYQQCYELLEHTRSVMNVFETARMSADIIYEADHK